MGRPKGKRLELFLPPDHPLFSYPSGQRAARAKELINKALSLEEQLAKIEQRLDQIAQTRGKEEVTNPEQIQNNKVSFDVEAFMDL